jgi:hypothetical protein
LVFPSIAISLLNAFLEEIKTKAKISAAVKNPITYAPNSKNQIPKNDTNTKPIRIYSCSNIIIGTVLLLGIPNFVFNRCDLTSRPTFPGIIINAFPDKKINKLSFLGMKILEFFSNKSHLTNSTNQLDVTSEIMMGKNSILKLEILSYTVLISDAIKNTV